jgi:hypothetical protein
LKIKSIFIHDIFNLSGYRNTRDIMSKKMYMLFLVLIWSACFVSVNIASAQTVDPCWYGCPKDGCLGCYSGGTQANNTNLKTTSRHCKQTRSIRLRDCRHYYTGKADREKYNACIAKDKEIFEECLKTVK